jgi:hypothetical protein
LNNSFSEEKEDGVGSIMCKKDEGDDNGEGREDMVHMCCVSMVIQSNNRFEVGLYSWVA